MVEASERTVESRTMGEVGGEDSGEATGRGGESIMESTMNSTLGGHYFGETTTTGRRADITGELTLADGKGKWNTIFSLKGESSTVYLYVHI